MIAYADSSFLVALYVLDRHSKDAAARVAHAPRILVTPFHRVELANAFYQCVFRSTLKEFEAAGAWKRFTRDLDTRILESLPFPDSAWKVGANLAPRFCPSLGVRSLDSLHVACALELGAQRFWTFDDRQARLAEAAGLDTRP